MNLVLTLTANAGVIMEKTDGKVFLLDALHNTPELEFSALTQEMAAQVFHCLTGKNVAAILVTHPHPDHYSEELTEKAKELFSDADMILPWANSTERYRLYSRTDYSVMALPLPHRYAPNYPTVSNYGFWIDLGDGKTVFTSGDADPLSEEMIRVSEKMHPNVAMLPFLWVTSEACREVLDTLAPKKLILFHLPFENMDPCRYQHITESKAKRFYPDAVILSRFLQSTEFEI